MPGGRSGWCGRRGEVPQFHPQASVRTGSLWRATRRVRRSPSRGSGNRAVRAAARRVPRDAAEARPVSWAGCSDARRRRPPKGRRQSSPHQPCPWPSVSARVPLKPRSSGSSGRRRSASASRSCSTDRGPWPAAAGWRARANSSRPSVNCRRTRSSSSCCFHRRHMEPPDQHSAWVHADRDRIDAVVTWVKSVNPGEGTYPKSAFELVFGLNWAADIIYFLTDGEIEGFARWRTASACGQRADPRQHDCAREQGERRGAARHRRCVRRALHPRPERLIRRHGPKPRSVGIRDTFEAKPASLYGG